MTAATSEKCLTCYGTGEVVSEGGAAACPDCYGNGTALPGDTAVEWRLRDLERVYAGARGEHAGDIRWLVDEVRASRDALRRIVARCEDDDGELALAVKHVANDVLKLYERTPAKS